MTAPVAAEPAPVPVVQLRAISKEYRGVAAVQSVDFRLEPGEVHALLGENGAGKTTLTKIMAGAVTPTSGEMLFEGEPVAFATPSEALERGIAMVFQETSLVPSLTVAQNLYLGREKTLNRLRGLYIAAQQFLQSLGFDVDSTEFVSSLGAAQRQMVEIARAVHHDAKVIIFDEPTATLTPEEKHHFFSLVERLRQRGISTIFISHVLEEALSVADRVTVLRDGQLVITDEAGAFDRDSIIKAMVGRVLSDELYGDEQRESRPYGDQVLSVQNLSMQNIVKNTSFSVYAGQVTGIFGLIGSGRTETAKTIAGVLKRDFFHGGEIFFEGNPVRYRIPRQAIRDGIVYVTEDRKEEGFFSEMSIDQNIAAGMIAGRRSRPGIMNMAQLRRAAEKWRESLQVKTIDGNSRVVELSGGNQQKLVIAKSLSQEPRLIIFDEPTRGVDVGAIAEIHRLIEDLADRGMAIIVISSYLPEILKLSDRILVSRKGRIVEEFDPLETTEERIMYAAVH